MKYIAHTPPTEGDAYHYLDDHTEGVLQKAIEFSKSFDPYGITAASALAHDLGKMTKEFQQYIQEENPKRGSVKHALGGTIILNRINDSRAKLAGIIVAGHHAGLPDGSRIVNEKIPNAEKYLSELPNATHQEEKRIEGLLQTLEPLPNLSKDDSVYADMLVKMCFSSLVDADFLDTEEYMDKQRSLLRERTDAVFIHKLDEKLQTYMAELVEEASNTPLNRRRLQVYQSCLEQGLSSQSFRSLNVPTGLGKTLAAMGYALKHAENFNKKRVIVALPYTSIIDQSAQVYKGIFGEDEVLEHHSQVDFSDDESEQMSSMRLAAENWDRSIIVTTTVQLFESVFSNRTSKCRKLHNIADSVIILDEFQKLPIEVLEPIFRALKILMDKFNVTVVVSSATPLSFDKPELFGNINAPIEICPYNHELFEEMKRVEYEFLRESLSSESLVNRMEDCRQVLCIVNTRKDAMKVYKEMKKFRQQGRKVYHLSTLMCPHHRKKVIANIQVDLENEKSIAVVSTSLIEAGIDFDFPTVYRAMAPIDSIVQAAGRCNREGGLDSGKVYIFELKGGRLPKGTYTRGTEQTRILLKRNGADSLHKLTTYHEYFRGLYSLEGEDGLDKYEITSAKPFAYETVDGKFKMIEQKTVSVLCRNYNAEVENIERLLKEAKELPYLTKKWYRKAQMFSVNIGENSRFLKEHSCQLEQIAEGWYVWKGEYKEVSGVSEFL
ncbi:CRISPR-associated helicase Cas3' [Sporosarcina sp. FSL K6-3457]|uniref:CRISPR-associated helicase Cas3' n=1 Tax=Sporosarcina sp. FSL K6-3457 TaxID=2978204 RepID=UPI0030FCCF39